MAATLARNRNEVLLFLAGVVVAVIAPYFAYPLFLMKVCYVGLFALAFNLLFGYAGLLSFGHCAFFGAAAYFTGHALKVWGLPPEAAMALGICLGTLLGWAFGWLAIRRSGISFAMITFALAEVVYFLANRLSFTGGESGLIQVPRGTLLGLFDLSQSKTMYYFSLAVFIACFLATVRIIRSPFGLALRAIRQNERRAISLGYKVEDYKLKVFVISACLASVAGSLKVVVMEFASLADVSWQTGGQIILMTLVGGIGTLAGPVVGAFLVLLLEEYLAFLGQWVTFVIGAIFVGCVLGFRRGIAGELPYLAKALGHPFRKASANGAHKSKS